MRKLVVLVTGVLILAWANTTIFSHERTVSEGRRVLLELAPVDPRSLMQGDFMELRFAAEEQAMMTGLPSQGRLVITVDENDVGTFDRFDLGGVVGDDEVRLRYRLRHSVPELVTNAFFFQEGDGDLYREARYGELRVAGDGDAVLVGLLDEHLRPLGPGTAPPD